MRLLELRGQRNWPTARAAIVRVRDTVEFVVSPLGSRSRGRPAEHVLLAEYRYRIDDREFTGFHRVRFSQAQAARFRTGDTIVVHVDPEWSNESVLKPLSSPTAWLSATLGAVLLTLGAGLHRRHVRSRNEPG